MKNYRVFPSLPARSFDELSKLVGTLSDAINEIQVDIVDGKFAPSISWPFKTEDPKGSMYRLSNITKELIVEMDCMVEAPEQYFPIFYEIGVKRVVLHYKSTANLLSAALELRRHNIEVGLAFTSDTNPEDIYNLIKSVDFVQVMGIAEVGEQGHPFDERSLKTIEETRMLFPDIDIAVDGAVNEKTILKLKQAGANVFLPGSAVSRAKSPREALIELRQLAGS